MEASFRPASRVAMQSLSLWHTAFELFYRPLAIPAPDDALHNLDVKSS